MLLGRLRGVDLKIRDHYFRQKICLMFMWLYVHFRSDILYHSRSHGRLYSIKGVVIWMFGCSSNWSLFWPIFTAHVQMCRNNYLKASSYYLIRWLYAIEGYFAHQNKCYVLKTILGRIVVLWSRQLQSIGTLGGELCRKTAEQLRCRLGRGLGLAQESIIR